MRSAIAVLLACAAAAQETPDPVRSVPDPGVVTTRQAITPAGVQAVFQGRVYGVAFGASSDELWVLNAARVFRFDWRQNRVLDSAGAGGTGGLQALRYQPESGRALVAAVTKGRVRLSAVHKGQTATVAADLGSNLAGALALSSKNVAVVPLTADNQLAIVDLSTSRVMAKAPTGIAPFGAAINRAGTIAYVTNWGGRLPNPGDVTAPAGLDPKADRVVVDGRGIAATGTVTRVDLASGKPTHTIPTGLHPTGLVWDEGRGRLYVANSNSDSITVVDTATQQVARTIVLQPFPVRTPGIAPTAVALSGDGERLYVACGGLNAIAVIDTAAGRLLGMIPTAWYPNSVAVSPDGRYLAVSTLLGPGSGSRDEPRKRFVHAVRGSISVIPVPERAELASYTTVVAENNRIRVSADRPRAAATKVAPLPVPERAGDPSPIEHVVYIIKENRTYDQVLGGMQKGNGDPSLVMFGEDVTPNHHRLADQFVLLDNFYASGGNSADGHQWVTQANETAYCLWPGYTGRSYPFDGTDPIAPSQSGFIWDAALRQGKTVRVYGEYAGRMRENPRERIALLEQWKAGADFSKRWSITAPIAPLNKILAANYPAYTPAIPDVVRTRIFLDDLRKWEASGTMPNLAIVQLPSDHTYGASPGTSTPAAMVADNDLALGEMVEALSRSKFWKKMAIFVVEDDAQNGVDHVDGHRTVALVVSPYTRRNHVDSTFYSHQSILKTIELILGLPTLSLFDLIANDMRASFQSAPDYRPYQHAIPKQSLFDVNPAKIALRGAPRRAAVDSEKMRWDVPDAVPTERLNRINWHLIRGWKTPYPGSRRALFAPLSIDIDDDDR